MLNEKEKSHYNLVLTGKQTGGFLPLLIPALAAIGKAAGLGAVGYLGSKVMQKITGKGLKRKKPCGIAGSGVYLPGKRV